jgi:hypothetical protein
MSKLRDHRHFWAFYLRGKGFWYAFDRIQSGHHSRSGLSGGGSVELIRTPSVRDVSNPKLSRERIILIEVLWYVQVGNQIFTMGLGPGNVGG